jgi:hypothetical protein
MPDNKPKERSDGCLACGESGTLSEIGTRGTEMNRPQLLAESFGLFPRAAR